VTDVQAISKDGQSSKALIARVGIINPSCGSIDPLLAIKDGHAKKDLFGSKSLKLAAGEYVHSTKPHLACFCLLLDNINNIGLRLQPWMHLMKMMDPMVIMAHHATQPRRTRGKYMIRLVWMHMHARHS
jgi:hypothetical protein